MGMCMRGPIRTALSREALRKIVLLDRRYLSGNELTLRQARASRTIRFVEDGRIVAYLILEKHRDIFRIRSILVLPEYRGTGLAKRLIKSSIRLVRGIAGKGTAIHTYAASWNLSSINLLVIAGFRIIGIRNDPLYGHGWVHFKRYV